MAQTAGNSGDIFLGDVHLGRIRNLVQDKLADPEAQGRVRRKQLNKIASKWVAAVTGYRNAIDSDLPKFARLLPEAVAIKVQEELTSLKEHFVPSQFDRYINIILANPGRSQRVDARENALRDVNICMDKTNLQAFQHLKKWPGEALETPAQVKALSKELHKIQRIFLLAVSSEK